ncbi:zinc-binding dehydrogenase [Vibrio sp. D420a]|nr:zinc-binding dehydrogenase [Vibrio sp. D420a]
MLAEGKVKPIYSTMPLSQAAQAHDDIESGKVMGKLILTPNA